MVLFRPNDVGLGDRLDIKSLNKEKNEKAVLVQCTIYGLYDIYPVRQCFSCELTVKMWWWEPKLAEKSVTVDELMLEHDNPDILIPALFYENALTTVDDVDGGASIKMRKEWGPGVVGYERRVRSTFKDIFELAKFPYDVQSLTIQLRINSKSDTLRKRYIAFNDTKKGKKLFLRPQLKPIVFKQSEWQVFMPAVTLARDGRKETAPLVYYHVHLILRRKHCQHPAPIRTRVSGAHLSLSLTHTHSWPLWRSRHPPVRAAGWQGITPTTSWA